jgi:ATP-binding protein involved in chromosome partitioning
MHHSITALKITVVSRNFQLQWNFQCRSFGWFSRKSKSSEKSEQKLQQSRELPQQQSDQKLSELSRSGQKNSSLQHTEIPGVKRIIAVASGKGGVGKSTVAVNIALGLSRLGLRIGLLDADIYGPSIPLMMNLKHKRPELKPNKFMLPLTNYGVKCISSGFLVPDDLAYVWRGPMVMGAVQQLLYQVEWGELDVMVIDMPPGTGDAHLTVTQRVPVSGAVIVSTPQDIALIDARRGITMFKNVNVPILGIIENMSGFVCPNCHEVSYIFGHGGAKQTAHQLGVDFLGEIPLDPSIRGLTDQGKPIVIAEPESIPAKKYMEICQIIQRKLSDMTSATNQQIPKIIIEK